MQTAERVLRLFCFLLWHLVQAGMILAGCWLLFQGGHRSLAIFMIVFGMLIRHEELDPEGKREGFNIWPLYAHGRWKAEQKRVERERKIMVEYIKASKIVSLREAGVDPDLIDKIDLTVNVVRG